MALTRKFLKAMGIEDEKIEQIIEAHTETTDSLKAEKEAALAAKQTAEEALTKAKTDNDDSENSYKAKYEAEHTAFESYKSEAVAKVAKARKVDAYTKLLKDSGIDERRIPSIIRVTDIDKVTINEDGTIKDADTLSASAKTEWADFVVTKGTNGAHVPTPPTPGTVDTSKMSDDDFFKNYYQKGN